MSRMIRKQVYIEPRQEELLKRQARELGVPESELIRRGIDQIARTNGTLAPEEEIWQEEKTYIEERVRLNVPQTGRTWDRDELYDERLQRSSR